MTETRSSVYRGSSRELVERTYHDDARLAAGQGYVPTAEDWSTALGQQVLTVTFAHLPDQAPSVLRALEDLRREPTRPAVPVTLASPSAATPAAPIPVRKGTDLDRVIGGLIAMIVSGSYLATSYSGGYLDSTTAVVTGLIFVAGLIGLLSAIA